MQQTQLTQRPFLSLRYGRSLLCCVLAYTAFAVYLLCTCLRRPSFLEFAAFVTLLWMETTLNSCRQSTIVESQLTEDTLYRNRNVERVMTVVERVE